MIKAHDDIIVTFAINGGVI